jgi:RNA polymerase sigma-70 factor (ECF subfamily)
MTSLVRPAAPRTDAELVARVLGGARAEFEQLVRRHNQRLYRAARAITHADADAEDVVQATWLSVYRNLHQFRGDAAFPTWATRIAIREAITQVRKRPQIAEVRDDTAVEGAPDDGIARAQLGRLLEDCLHQIPQGNREVMVLRDVLELDTAETAECLGLTEEAVRVRLHRGRAAVAAALTARMSDDVTDIYTIGGQHCDRITARVMAAIAAL